MTTWPLPQTSTLSERSAHCLVLSCLYIVTCTRTVAQVMSLSHHPHVHVHVSVSPRLALPYPFPALPAALLLPPALEVRRLQPAAHSAQRGYGLFWRVPPHHRVRVDISRKGSICLEPHVRSNMCLRDFPSQTALPRTHLRQRERTRAAEEGWQMENDCRPAFQCVVTPKAIKNTLRLKTPGGTDRRTFFLEHEIGAPVLFAIDAQQNTCLWTRTTKSSCHSSWKFGADQFARMDDTEDLGGAKLIKAWVTTKSDWKCGMHVRFAEACVLVICFCLIFPYVFFFCGLGRPRNRRESSCMILR